MKSEAGVLGAEGVAGKLIEAEEPKMIERMWAVSCRRGFRPQRSFGPQKLWAQRGLGP